MSLQACPPAVMALALLCMPAQGQARTAPAEQRLLDCVASCTPPQLQAMLRGRQVAQVTPERRAALVARALEGRNAAALGALLAWGVDANAPMPFTVAGERLDISPLLYALSARSGLPCVQVLVARGADTNLPSSGLLPLHWALGTQQYGVAAYLLDQGADARRTDGSGSGSITALASGARDADTAQAGAMARRLAKLGADVNAVGPQGSTALGMAVLSGHLGLTEALLQLGADPNTRNGEGHTPREMAQRKQRQDIAELLTRHGAVP